MFYYSQYCCHYHHANHFLKQLCKTISLKEVWKPENVLHRDQKQSVFNLCWLSVYLRQREGCSNPMIRVHFTADFQESFSKLVKGQCVSLVISVTFGQSCCESLHHHIQPTFYPVCLCCPCCFSVYIRFGNTCSQSPDLMSEMRYVLIFSQGHRVCVCYEVGRNTGWIMHHSCVCPLAALRGCVCQWVWELLWL